MMFLLGLVAGCFLWGCGKASGLGGEGQYHSAVVPAKSIVRPANAGTHSHQRQFCEERLPLRLNREHNAVWVPAFAGTTSGESPPHPNPLRASFARLDPARAGRGSRTTYTDAVVTPPSTTMVWPVMKLEASEPR